VKGIPVEIAPTEGEGAEMLVDAGEEGLRTGQAQGDVRHIGFRVDPALSIVKHVSLSSAPYNRWLVTGKTKEERKGIVYQRSR
jgi:hypothetical protein